MKGRFLYLVVLGIFLIFQFPACLATERTGQNKSCKYLGVVRVSLLITNLNTGEITMCKPILTALICLMMKQGIMAEQMSTSDLLDRYEATQAKIKNYGDKGIYRGEVMMPEGKTFFHEESVFYIDGDRIRWLNYQWRGLKSMDEPTPIEQGYKRDYIWDGERAFEYRKPKDLYGQLFIDSEDKMRKHMIGLGYNGAPLIGIFEGDLEPVSLLLRQARTISVRPQQEQVGGSSCYIIDAVTDHGKYTIWIDPEHGYNIAKAQVYKKEGDIAWGKPLEWLGDLSNWRGPKPARLRGLSFTLKNVRFDKINGVWIPMEADYETTKKRDDYDSAVKAHYRRTYFEADPDFDAINAFVPDIPNGTRVFIWGVQGIKYEWKDGEPVTVVD